MTDDSHVLTEVVIFKNIHGETVVDLQRYIEKPVVDPETGMVRIEKCLVFDRPQLPPGVSSHEAARIQTHVESLVRPDAIHPLLRIDYDAYDYSTGSGHYVSLTLPLKVSVHTASLDDDPESELDEAFEHLEHQLERSLQLIRKRKEQT